MRDGLMAAEPVPATMLIVGDHLRWIEAVADHFRTDEVSLVVADGGEAAVGAAQRLQPGFVALDVDLLGGSVMQVCREIRNVCDSHVTMCSSAGNENVVVAGLRAGADDVLTGPRSSRELAARVRAALRRWQANEALAESRGPMPRRYSYGPLSIDVGRREVRIADERIGLTRTQFDILVELARRRGAVATRRDLMEAVWGSRSSPNTERVSVHIAALRRRLGDDSEEPAVVLSVRGVGYRLALAPGRATVPPCGGNATASPVTGGRG